MSIDQRPEYKAAQIQAEADGRLSPERIVERDKWRARIMGYIAGRLPLDIDLDKLTDDERGTDG